VAPQTTRMNKSPYLRFCYEVHAFIAVIADDKLAFLRSRAHTLLLSELPTVRGRQDELQGREAHVPDLVAIAVLVNDVLLELRLDVSHEVGEDTVERNCWRKCGEL
jgi:hypothetical protein